MWQWSAITAMGCFAGMQLLFTYLGRRGMPPPATLLFVFAFGLVLYASHVLIARTPVPVDRTGVMLLALAAVLSYTGNYHALRALALAPNPGYSVAVVSTQTVIVTIAATALLGASFSLAKLAGVLLCGAGVALLAL